MRVRLVGVSVLMFGLAAMFGCGGGGSSSTTGTTTAPSAPTAAAAPAPSTITILGQNGTQAFAPNPAAFGGQQVVFKNNDTVIHHIVLNDGSVDTGDIAPGATSKAVTMPSAGTNYHCSIHLGMIGGIDSASSAAPPPCTGPYCTGY
jgi:plastocyanin